MENASTKALKVLPKIIEKGWIFHIFQAEKNTTLS
jgi:hypothetical protein